MNKKNFKIFRLYLIGLLCIVIFTILESSSIIPELVEKSNNDRYNGFLTFILTGFFKYGILIIGISIVTILSFFLIKNKFAKGS
ncbi:hypothetical protein FUA24_24275 [Seonamhaeicola marinus]|uniref:Uncharacterized protein n=1 Tax=Seonamhaeicola marinus TaxID=1912246 RepID=A0A5D0H420_9FLAO|nr:hypothetical protein FUA24_24275 [Seonamhaeicola marinus]